MLRLDKNMLPVDAVERSIYLRSYFCDKDVDLVDRKSDWELEFYWSKDPYRYVDPNLKLGLEWWDPQLNVNEIPLARRREGNITFALYDTWTLESWSNWLVTKCRSTPNKLTILHVDDHKDLASPRIFKQGSKWLDPLLNKEFDLFNPSSVNQSIKSGAIGMGSFMTPFIFYFPDAQIRHLCQPPKCTQTIDYAVNRLLKRDSLISSDALRPGIELSQHISTSGPASFRYTSDLNDWLIDINEGPILLHIDLDYFCNRFDGDTDAIDDPYPLNPSLEEVLSKASDLCAALHERDLVSKIEDIVIAFSPGFFPAEYWKPVSDYLQSQLSN